MYLGLTGKQVRIDHRFLTIEFQKELEKYAAFFNPGIRIGVANGMLWQYFPEWSAVYPAFSEYFCGMNVEEEYNTKVNPHEWSSLYEQMDLPENVIVEVLPYYRNQKPDENWYSNTNYYISCDNKNVLESANKSAVRNKLRALYKNAVHEDITVKDIPSELVKEVFELELANAEQGIDIKIKPLRKVTNCAQRIAATLVIRDLYKESYVLGIYSGSCLKAIATFIKLGGFWSFNSFYSLSGKYAKDALVLGTDYLMSLHKHIIVDTTYACQFFIGKYNNYKKDVANEKRTVYGLSASRSKQYTSPIVIIS